MGGDKKVISYIKKQLANGYTRGEIVSHLARSGHTRDSAERNFELAIAPRTQIVRRIIEFLSIVALAVLIFWIGFSSNAPFGSVIAGFLPSIVSLLFLISVVETKRHVEYIWGMPVVFSLAFLVLGLLQAPPFGKMEIGKLTFLNLIISYVFLVIISYPEAYKKIEFAEEKREERDIEHHFRSIEDKCKALNFVIGRVYRSSNGGTTSMRDDIRIASELYNEFDRAVKEGTKEQMVEALDKVGHRLMSLQKTEKEIFGDRIIHLKNLARDDNGHSRVIDVLAKNDNDPVMNYYSDALEAYKEIRRQVVS
jgi:hypothetical protein